MANNMQDELEAMAIWESHLESAANQWKEGVSESRDDFRSGLASFLGVNENEISDTVTEDWEQGVQNMSADEFAQSVREEGSDWLEGLYRGVAGREPPQRIKQMARDIEHNARERAGAGAGGEELAHAMRREIRNRAEESHTGQQGGQGSQRNR